MSWHLDMNVSMYEYNAYNIYIYSQYGLYIIYVYIDMYICMHGFRCVYIYISTYVPTNVNIVYLLSTFMCQLLQVHLIHCVSPVEEPICMGQEIVKIYEDLCSKNA